MNGKVWVAIGVVLCTVFPSACRVLGAEKAEAKASPVDIPAEHPRLLIHREELGVLRARCGLGGPAGTGKPSLKPTTANVFQALQRWVDRTMTQEPPSGFLYSPALMHLLTGQPGKPDAYSHYVAQQLLVEGPRLTDSFDEVVALDWCWDAIKPEQRDRIVRRLLTDAKSLTRADSPFQHFRFFPKLRALATVLTAHGEGLARLRKVTLGEALLDPAQQYLEGPFIEVMTERGAVGTSPTAALTENLDAAFAAEIWQTGAGRPMWTRLRSSLGRACESYFYGLAEWPSLDHGFVHDDGSFSPSRPLVAAETSVPILPWVIGHRTGDPFAGWFARTVLKPGVLAAAGDPLSRHWWARIVYGGATRHVADRSACPPARNLGGGWVAMRSDFSAGATLVLFDVGQPLFRSRQHLDAGHFVVYRKGRLAHGSGQDVTFQAIPARRGFVKIGNAQADWEPYFQSTGAHNCVTVTDRLFRQERHRKIWPSGDGQLVVEGDYKPADGSLADAGRQRGHLVAFQTEAEFSYAACDLAGAYPVKIVKSYTRELLFLHAGLIVVVDRLTTAKADQVVRWNLQLISRPGIGGEDLPGDAQVNGATPAAGIWAINAPKDWLHVDDGGGRLYVKTVLPYDHRWRIIGGPKEVLTIREGRHTGVKYVGGSKDSFEHWMYRPRISKGVNVWYRLGRPSGLGPHFQLGMNWGHLETEAIQAQTEHLFCHVLAAVDRDDKPPKLNVDVQEGLLLIRAEVGSRRLTVKIPLEGGKSGQVSGGEANGPRDRWSYPLATDVRPDARVPLDLR